MLHQLRVQNAQLDRVGFEARTEIIEFIRVRKLVSSELGLDVEDIPTEIAEVLEPLSEDHIRGYDLAEALHAHRIRSLRVMRRFLSAAKAGKVSWLHPLDTQDPKDIIESASADVSRLEASWTRVQQNLAELRTTGALLQNLMANINKQYEEVAFQIDTAYPEVSIHPFPSSVEC